MQRTAPSRLGSVMWWPSPHMPKPVSSAKIGAPRSMAWGQFFQHQNTGAFGHHETVVPLVEGPAGGGGIVVIACGQGPHPVKTRQGQAGSKLLRRLRPASRLLLPIGWSGRRAPTAWPPAAQALDKAVLGPLRPETDGDIAGSQVREQLGHHERGNPFNAPFIKLAVRLLPTGHPAHAGGDDGAQLFRIYGAQIAEQTG